MKDLAAIFLRRAQAAGAGAAPTLAGRAVVLPSDDAPEPDSGGAGDYVGTALFIDYIDAKGQASARRITVHTARPTGKDLLLNCYCHERRAARGFRASRIAGATDTATGEIIEDVAQLIRLLCGEAGFVEASLQANTQRTIKKHRPGLLALLFLARCDGFQHPSETQVILNYLDHNAPPPGIDRDTALQILARTSVDASLFERVVWDLADDEAAFAQVARFARHLIDADGALSPEEAEFAQKIANFTD